MDSEQVSSIRQPQQAPHGLPANTSWQSIGGVDGWLYSLFDPYGEQYVFFLWNDGVNFAVSLVHPALEQDPDAADMKVQADGRLGPFGPRQIATARDALEVSLAWVAYRAIHYGMTATADQLASRDMASMPNQ